MESSSFYFGYFVGDVPILDVVSTSGSIWVNADVGYPLLDFLYGDLWLLGPQFELHWWRILRGQWGCRLSENPLSGHAPANFT